jgi:hypothetical protein
VILQVHLLLIRVLAAIAAFSLACCHSGRLIELCEERLVAELLQLAPVAAAAEAPHLLCLADELGLIQLRTAAIAFIAQHYTEVQVCCTKSRKPRAHRTP